MSAYINDENRSERSTARLLRLISVYTFIPALAFNIAHGVVYFSELPALGLIPHAFSVGLAVYELGWWDSLFRGKEYRIILQDDPEGDKPSSLRTVIVTLLDTLFGLSLTGCTVGAYIMMPVRSNWYYGSDTGLIILGTYATLPYIVNA